MIIANVVHHMYFSYEIKFSEKDQGVKFDTKPILLSLCILDCSRFQKLFDSNARVWVFVDLQS